MALIKHRPRIRLLLVPQLEPGETFVATVIVEARRVVPVEVIEVDLEGVEERSIGSGQYKIVRRRDICFLRARIDPGGELPVGRSEYRCRFTLPASAPPTYAGDRVRISYLMNVRASIPWWPDAKASFEVNVGPGNVHEGTESKPVLFSSRPEGPSANEPHLEGSLTSNSLVPGGIVSGAIALSNVAFTRYAGLRLALVGMEWVTIGGRQSENEAQRYEIDIPLDKPREGEPYQFRMRLPDRVPVSYRHGMWSLTWYFECKAQIRWSHDLILRLPVTVLPRRTRSSARRTRLAPPTVGSERVQVLWRDVARAHGLEFDSRRIHGSIGDSEPIGLVVEREHRGGGGVFLVGTLSYASLHLDLAVEPKKGWLRLGDTGIQLGDKQWDKDHHVSCRDRSQLNAMSSSLLPTLTRFRSVRMLDESAVVELRNAGASKSKLGAFVRNLVALAHGISHARQQIPPPALMHPHTDAWKDLARNLDGALENARMAVTGSLAGVAVAVRTEWTPDGEPLQTVIEARPSMTIAEEHHVSVVADDSESLLDQLDEVGESPGLESIPGAARNALDEARRLDIASEVLTVALPAPIKNTKDLLTRLRALVEWTRQLSASAGPYR